MSVFTEQQKLTILEDLVAINSVNENEIEIAEYLKKLFAEYGIDSTIVPVTETRVNLVAEIGSGSPVFGISGHMDVVSPGDVSNWSTDPFVLTEKEGKLYGRGANDMKSGLAALAIAMIELKESNSLTKGSVRFMATTGEEVGGAGSKKLYEEGYMDDVDALIVAEPSQDVIVYSHKGSLNFKVTSKGQEAHSAMPHLGYNAIDPLAEFITRVNAEVRDPSRSNETLGELIMNCTIVQGGQQVNSIPEVAAAEFNVRTIPEYDTEEVIAKFNEIAEEINKQKDAKIHVEVTMALPSVFTDGKSELVEIAQDLGKKYFGEKPGTIGSPGVTDGSNFLRSKGDEFPFMMFGPGLTKMAHKIDEYVHKDVYLKFIDLYKEMILAFNQ